MKKKFLLPRKRELRQRLYSGDWALELVVNEIRHPEELKLISGQGINVYRLADIVKSLERESFAIQSAAGADLVDLVGLG